MLHIPPSFLPSRNCRDFLRSCFLLSSLPFCPSLPSQSLLLCAAHTNLQLPQSPDRRPSFLSFYFVAALFSSFDLFTPRITVHQGVFVKHLFSLFRNRTALQTFPGQDPPSVSRLFSSLFCPSSTTERRQLSFDTRPHTDTDIRFFVLIAPFFQGFKQFDSIWWNSYLVSTRVARVRTNCRVRCRVSYLGSHDIS